MQFIYLCYISLSYALFFYLNNTMVEHECSTRGWAMMVHPNCVDLWKFKKPMHGNLRANDKDIEQIFDAAKRQVHTDGALASRSCKCFLLSPVTRENVYITRLRTRQGILDTGAMKFMIWDFGRDVYRTLYLIGFFMCLKTHIS
ncbi:hypothetical protein GOP47_0025227 [Adiantum capillus-veneris]|uniref:Uncharacterized protein n=1 Tax=Adiantum capillus-veneris TaxID=13818 RepID=A0A9D4U4A4_ADICA|nr:hypothetical protein GOP47_0025227 [Adiantum capillus-veneris]